MPKAYHTRISVYPSIKSIIGVEIPEDLSKRYDSFWVKEVHATHATLVLNNNLDTETDVRKLSRSGFDNIIEAKIPTGNAWGRKFDPHEQKFSVDSEIKVLETSEASAVIRVDIPFTVQMVLNKSRKVDFLRRVADGFGKAKLHWEEFDCSTEELEANHNKFHNAPHLAHSTKVANEPTNEVPAEVSESKALVAKTPEIRSISINLEALKAIIHSVEKVGATVEFTIKDSSGEPIKFVAKE